MALTPTATAGAMFTGVTWDLTASTTGTPATGDVCVISGATNASTNNIDAVMATNGWTGFRRTNNNSSWACYIKVWAPGDVAKLVWTASAGGAAAAVWYSAADVSGFPASVADWSDVAARGAAALTTTTVTTGFGTTPAAGQVVLSVFGERGNSTTTCTVNVGQIDKQFFSSSGTGGSGTIAQQTTVGGGGPAAVTATYNLSHANAAAIMIPLTMVVANVPPVASAGPDQTGIAPGATVTLTAAGSTDSDGTVVGYAWTQLAGPAVTLSNAAVVSPTFTAPSVYGGTSLTFQVVVTDDDGATHSDTVNIAVTTGPDSISYVGVGSISVVFTSATPGYPTVAANDRLVLATFSDVNVQPANPSGWGTGTTVAGAGGMYLTMWSKIATGSETGTISVTGFTGGTKGVSWIVGYRALSGLAPYVQLATGGDSNTSSTLFEAISATNWTALVGDIILGGGASLAPTGSYSANATTVSAGGTGGTMVGSSSTKFNARTATNTISYMYADYTVSTAGTGFGYVSATMVGANGAGMGALARVSMTGSNSPPVANAGPDQSVNAGDVVTLTAAGSTDPDGSVVSYAWTQTVGPTVTLSNAAVVSPTFTAPSVSGGTLLTFSVLVTDNLGATHSDTVNITVAAPTPQIIYVGVGAPSAVSTVALPGYPAGILAGDMFVMYAFSNVNVQPANPSGWGTGTTTASGGGMYVTMWTKTAVGSETGTVSISGFTGGTKGASWIGLYRGSSTLYVAGTRTGADTDSSSTVFSATGSSIPVLATDMLVGGATSLAPTGTYTTGMTGVLVGLTSGGSGVSTTRLSARTGTNTIDYVHGDCRFGASTTSTPLFSGTTTGAPGTGVAGFVLLSLASLNVAPTASAGPDQSVLPNTTVTLTSAASTDPDGTIVSRLWTQLSGETVTLSSTTATSPTFTSPMPLGAETLVFQVEVTDDDGATGTDTVSIAVASHTSFYFNGTDWRPCRISTIP